MFAVIFSKILEGFGDNDRLTEPSQDGVGVGGVGVGYFTIKILLRDESLKQA
jgi:hypothetical protein